MYFILNKLNIFFFVLKFIFILKFFVYSYEIYNCGIDNYVCYKYYIYLFCLYKNRKYFKIVLIFRVQLKIYKFWVLNL